MTFIQSKKKNTVHPNMEKAIKAIEKEDGKPLSICNFPKSLDKKLTQEIKDNYDQGTKTSKREIIIKALTQYYNI